MKPLPAGLLALATIAGPASAQALGQTLGQAPDDTLSFWRVAGALALCIALGIGAILALRARGGALPALPALVSGIRRERRLELVEVLRLNQHVDLCLVRCDGTAMLLAASAQGVDMLPMAAGKPVGAIDVGAGAGTPVA